jgi:hypothetical protein
MYCSFEFCIYKFLIFIPNICKGKLMVRTVNFVVSFAGCFMTLSIVRLYNIKW